MQAQQEMTAVRLKDFVDGEWVESKAGDVQRVENPATGELLALCPLGGEAEVGAAVRAAKAAFASWRRVPVEERVQYLFQLKFLLEQHAEDLARVVTRENGKTLAESRG